MRKRKSLSSKNRELRERVQWCEGEMKKLREEIALHRENFGERFRATLELVAKNEYRPPIKLIEDMTKFAMQVSHVREWRWF